ncbi:hypothetical protein H5P28_13295 [Ruficoccus amylovorans]|uniref:Uncharacterized protein n=1 Tax=Ruficoccus amylovorans TaxID=1804625 RepID=A0A842HI88_9BACT|nr:autotransporter-associated beta strand repeat-containing protein [Ruficoccus amylovorans]MBC2595237.1 hypothetical protein [Ruficoccus amylovorans]
MKKLVPPNILKVSGLGSLSLMLLSLSAQAQTWSGEGSNNNWSDAGNWSGSAPANDGTADISFEGTNRLTPNVDTDWSIAKMTFGSSAGAFEISGNDITINGASSGNYVWLQNNSSNLQTINNNIIYSGSASNFQIWATEGDITINGDIDLGTARSWLGMGNASSSSPARTITLNGNISGTGSRSLDTGTYNMTIILSGNNTFTGDVLNQRSKLILRHNNALGLAAVEFARNNNTGPSADAGVLTEGALTINNNFVVGDNTNATPSRAYIGGNTADTSEYTGNITLGNHSTRGRTLELVAVEGGKVTFSGNLIGAGTDGNDGVVKVGQGTVVLAGTDNTYKGTTLISEGMLLINGQYGATGGSITVESGATLGGTGDIDRAVTVEDGATLLAGDGSNAQTALNIGEDLQMDAGSMLKFVLSGAGESSTLNRTGGTWSFDLNQMIVLEGSGIQVGIYTGIISGLDEAIDVSGWTISNESMQGVFTYEDGEINLELTAVPEIRTNALLLGLAVLLCVAFHRRQNIRN